MPLLFSYGTLQKEEVQLSTLGRRLVGAEDELPGFEPAQVKIEDPKEAAMAGTSHHANARFSGNPGSRVHGMAFEVTDDELTRIDGYEAPFSYRRIGAVLASGRHAWVYVHAPGATGTRGVAG